MWVNSRSIRVYQSYLGTLFMLLLAPWLALATIILLGLVDGYTTGAAGRNGGMSQMLQMMGLYPHVVFVCVEWMIGVGALLAFAWLTGKGIAYGWMTYRNTRPAQYLEGVAQKTNVFMQSHQKTTAALVVIFSSLFMFLVQGNHPSPVALPAAQPPMVSHMTYSRVLLTFTNQQKIVSGNAQVRQIAPHTYVVKMQER